MLPHQTEESVSDRTKKKKKMMKPGYNPCSGMKKLTQGQAVAELLLKIKLLKEINWFKTVLGAVIKKKAKAPVTHDTSTWLCTLLYFACWKDPLPSRLADFVLAMKCLINVFKSDRKTEKENNFVLIILQI